MAIWLITFFAIVFVIAAAGAKRRANKRYDLPLENPALSIAILKENLLENPSEDNLRKLKEFALSQNIEFPKYEYPLGKAPTIEQDDSLFLAQATWLDSIKPLEFNEEPQTERTLINGILRLYSDEAIFKALEELGQKFPSNRQRNLELDWRKLCELRDNCKADYNSLEKLRMEKEKWEKCARE